MNKICIFIEAQDISDEDYSLIDVEKEIKHLLLKAITIGKIIHIEAERRGL